MKVSMSLPAEDVAFLDAYAQAQGYASRSAVLHRAVYLLRTADLSTAYEKAWQEWGESGDAEVWETVTGDGLGT